MPRYQSSVSFDDDNIPYLSQRTFTHSSVFASHRNSKTNLPQINRSNKPTSNAPEINRSSKPGNQTNSGLPSQPSTTSTSSFLHRPKKLRRASSMEDVNQNLPAAFTHDTDKELIRQIDRGNKPENRISFQNLPEDNSAARQAAIKARLENYVMPKSANQLRGLNNLGNTCYMNAVLQCLVRLPAFSDFFRSDEYKPFICHQNTFGFMGRLSLQFANLVKILWTSGNSCSPVELRQEISNKHKDFSSYNQQDAHEFLMAMLDGLHEDLNLSRKENKNIKIEEANDDELDGASVKIKHGKASELAWNRHLKLREFGFMKIVFRFVFWSLSLKPAY